MNAARFETLKSGIGSKIVLTGFQNPIDYPLSVKELYSEKELLEVFRFGNWATNTAFVWNDLAFVQRSHGGDEWLTLREQSDGSWEAFESICFYSLVQQNEERCSALLSELSASINNEMVDQNMEPTFG